MEILLPKPGGYVVAVSGGVDSMALLHMLYMQALADREWKLTIAHLDHGIRLDSAQDRELVQAAARQYDLPFVYKEAKLGAGTSEAKAREGRYGFLRAVMQAGGAGAIITAHHQDDVLETAIINILRGTNRKGLSSLGSSAEVVRPLLNVSKQELYDYAEQNGLKWREDSTNNDQTYLRNYVRHKLLPQFNDNARQELLSHIRDTGRINHELDSLLAADLYSHLDGREIDRYWFNQLPHAAAREILAAWLRQHDMASFDSKMLEKLVISGKTGAVNKRFPVLNGYHMLVNKDSLALIGPER